MCGFENSDFLPFIGIDNLLIRKEYYVFVSTEGQYYKVKSNGNETKISLVDKPYLALKGSESDMLRYMKNLKEDFTLIGEEFNPVGIMKIVEEVKEVEPDFILIDNLNERLEKMERANKYESAEITFIKEENENSLKTISQDYEEDDLIF